MGDKSKNMDIDQLVNFVECQEDKMNILCRHDGNGV